ncbi:MAG: hypothetical protein ACOCRK_02120 [bacterium]
MIVKRTNKKFRQDVLFLKKYIFDHAIIPKKGIEKRLYKLIHNCKYTYTKGTIGKTRKKILDEIYEGYFILTMNAFSLYNRWIFVEYLINHPIPNTYLQSIVNSLLKHNRFKPEELNSIKNNTAYSVEKITDEQIMSYLELLDL